MSKQPAPTTPKMPTLTTDQEWEIFDAKLQVVFATNEGERHNIVFATDLEIMGADELASLGLMRIPPDRSSIAEHIQLVNEAWAGKTDSPLGK